MRWGELGLESELEAEVGFAGGTVEGELAPGPAKKRTVEGSRLPCYLRH